MISFVRLILEHVPGLASILVAMQLPHGSADAAPGSPRGTRKG